MNREQAKIYASLTREQVSKLNDEYGKLYDLICAYADGATIEMKRPSANEWYEQVSPLFDAWSEYRVKEANDCKQALPKQETVESLDGHELSDAEKGVIRILRRCKVETMWNRPFVYLERQDTLRTCETGTLFKFESGAKASEFGDLADDVIAEAEERIEKGEPSW